MTLLCVPYKIPNQTGPEEKGYDCLTLQSAGPGGTWHMNVVWGSSFHHFPYDLSTPLLIVSPSDTTADHFYIILKMAFGSTHWTEVVRPV